MKVVLLHDWLLGFRGGERVFETFCEMFPQAPIYTLFYQPGSTSEVIDSHKVTTSYLNKIPGVGKHYRKLLPLFPSAAKSLEIIEDADLVLSSSHCVIKAVRKPKKSKHISYIHSPMRYLYDQFDVYFGKDAPWYQRNGIRFFKNYLTQFDQNTNSNVDLMIANSLFVKKRIKQYYGLDSHVVHPFVDLNDFKPYWEAIKNGAIKKENYFVMVTAFAPNKRVDLAIQAFNKMNLRLKIIGSGQQEKQLKEIAGSSIEFLGNVSRDEVIKTFLGAQALIFPGVEDFGITPLESLASGTPVIAFKSGGVLDTLNNSVAAFFETQTVEALCDQVRKFDIADYSLSNLLSRADDFSKEKFKQNIQNEIDGLL